MFASWTAQKLSWTSWTVSEADASAARSTKQTSERAQSSPVGSGPHWKHLRWTPSADASRVTYAGCRLPGGQEEGTPRARGAVEGGLVKGRDLGEVRRGAVDVDLVEEVVRRRHGLLGEARDVAGRHARLEVDARVAAGQLVGDELDDEDAVVHEECEF